MTGFALTLNGRPVRRAVAPRTHLGDFLREEMNLTGTHLGCEHGVCGACTILLDDVPARACITLTLACHDATVTTIEGLDDDEIAAELRAAFTREHALQCGYCTPGMMISARDLVIRLDAPDERQVRLGLSGNLCRCTGYVGIVRAVRAVIAERRARGVAAVEGAGRTALGPVGSHPGTGGGHAAGPERPVPAAGASTARNAATLDLDFDPAATFDQEFRLAHPPERVYALLGDVEAVASCLPGAMVTATPSPERVEGTFRARLGPISATFGGIARIERDPMTLSGRIVGAGAESGGRSSTKAEIRYRVLPDGEGGARVACTVGYSLSGMLAQFGRPGLVRDVASRITAEFAARMDRTLSGAASPPATAKGLNPATLIVGLARDRLLRIVKAIGRRAGRRLGRRR